MRATAFAVVAYRAIRYGELRSMLSVDGSGALEGVADDMVLHAGPCQRFARLCFDRATLVQLHVVRMDVSVGILDWNFVDDFGARSPTGVCGEFSSDVVKSSPLGGFERRPCGGGVDDYDVAVFDLPYRT